MSPWHMMTARQGSLVGLFLSALPLRRAMSVCSVVLGGLIYIPLSCSVVMCCMYMKQTMVACDRADQGENMRQFHSALAVHIWYACFS